MLVYNYDKRTGLYIGSSEADPSPLEPGKYLIPAQATKKVPPTPANENDLIIWDSELKEWTHFAAIFSETQYTKYTKGDGWVVKDLPLCHQVNAEGEYTGVDQYATYDRVYDNVIIPDGFVKRPLPVGYDPAISDLLYYNGDWMLEDKMNRRKEKIMKTFRPGFRVVREQYFDAMMLDNAAEMDRLKQQYLSYLSLMKSELASNTNWQEGDPLTF